MLATSRTAAPPRSGSFATGSPSAAPGCVRTPPSRYLAASTASPSRAASPGRRDGRRHRRQDHRALRARRPCFRAHRPRRFHHGNDACRPPTGARRAPESRRIRPGGQPDGNARAENGPDSAPGRRTRRRAASGGATWTPPRRRRRRTARLTGNPSGPRARVQSPAAGHDLAPSLAESRSFARSATALRSGAGAQVVAGRSLAGGWKTARMVAHYAAGATAEQGAVAKYL